MSEGENIQRLADAVYRIHNQEINTISTKLTKLKKELTKQMEKMHQHYNDIQGKYTV